MTLLSNKKSNKVLIKDHLEVIESNLTLFKDTFRVEILREYLVNFQTKYFTQTKLSENINVC